jgi:hypothetical protein
MKGVTSFLNPGGDLARSNRFALGRVPEPPAPGTAQDALNLACFGGARPGVDHSGRPAGESEPFRGSPQGAQGVAETLRVATKYRSLWPHLRPLVPMAGRWGLGPDDNSFQQIRRAGNDFTHRLLAGGQVIEHREVGIGNLRRQCWNVGWMIQELGKASTSAGGPRKNNIKKTL